MSFLPAIGAGMSIIGGLGGLFGGGSDQPNAPPPPPPTYQLQYTHDADANAMDKTGSLGNYNTAGQSLGQYGNIVQSLLNNPYASQYQQGANATAGLGWGTGLEQLGGASNLIQQGNSMLPYAQSILNTGFDPQNALYDRTLQQVTDQSRAAQSARGIAMSPYGAGVENKALSDFNIDWQNNLLNRQNTAAQGAGYLTNSAGNAINLGQNVGTLGLQTLTNAAGLPYATANTLGTNQLGTLGQYGQFGQSASAIPQQQIANYLQYLAAANSASGTANQGAAVQNQAYANQLTANNQQFNQGQRYGQNFGSGLQGLGNWWNGGGSSMFG